MTRDIYRVSRLLGHSSVTTTEIYASFDNEQLEKNFVNGKPGDSRPIQSASNYAAFLRENIALLQN